MSIKTMKYRWMAALAMAALLALLPVAGCTVADADYDDEAVEEGDEALHDADEGVSDREAEWDRTVDLDWAEVEILLGETTVDVPTDVDVEDWDVDVTTEERTVTVPLIDITWPDDEQVATRQTVTVEVQAATGSHVQIEEIWAYQDTLIVVSRLYEGGAEVETEATTLSDQVVVNAPELHVEHYVIASDAGAVEGDVTVVASTEEIADEIADARRIYVRGA